MKQNLGFRAWFYFRQGWATYFAFIFAAINTLTVTYFLAIERYPLLHSIFTSFINYVIIVSAIGIPLLILIGYIHFKRTAAHKSEIDISYETDPYKTRNLVNSEINVKINLKLMEIILRVTQGEKISQEEINQILKLKSELSDFVEKRKFPDKNDLHFFKDKLDKFRI